MPPAGPRLAGAPPVGQGSGGGPRRDLTQGPIGRTLLLFALPTLGSNILQSLNGSINAVWVGNFLGEGALAATSNANIIMFLMFGAVFGFGMAATVMVGQRFGAKDPEGARRAFGAALGLVTGAAVVIATLGWVFAPEILRVLATPPEAFDFALAYLRVIFLGLPPSMVVVLISMALRGTGDSVTPLWFMGLTVVIDATLNPLLILGIGPIPRMGIAGSAAATLVANVVTVAALTWYIQARDLPIRLLGAERRFVLPSAQLTRLIVSKGVPIGAQMIVISTSALTMIGLVNREGVITTAAYGVTQQLWAYVQMPALAIGAAVSAMAAQNIGAGKWDRVGSITRSGIIYNLLLTGVTIALLLLFDIPVLALFLGEGSAALPLARHIQVVATWGFLMFGATMVMLGTVRANGAVLVPLLILFVSVFPVRIGFATLAKPVLGVDALWWSFPAGFASTLVLASLYYRFGNWRQAGPMQVPPEAEEQAHATVEPGGVLKPTG